VESLWAMFSTLSGGALYARTNNGTTSTNTLIPGSWLGAPHRFRIDWNASNVVYWIDGVQVASHPISITKSMRPLASDFNIDGKTVSVDWLRMSPYAVSGTFLSRVFDAGGPASWGTASWTSETSVGTSLAMSVRMGDSPNPDGTWTAFLPLASSGAVIGGNSRYIQYQAVLSTTVASQTATLRDVTLGYTVSTPGP